MKCFRGLMPKYCRGFMTAGAKYVNAVATKGVSPFQGKLKRELKKAS